MSESYVPKFAFVEDDSATPAIEKALAVWQSTTADDPPELEKIPSEISTLDEADYLGELRAALGKRAAAVHKTFDAHIDRAHVQHKELLAERKKFLGPIEHALSSIRTVVGAYQQKLRAIEAAARAKAESERRKAEAKLRAKLVRQGVERNEAAAAAQAAAVAAKPEPAPERKPTGFGGTRKGAISIRVVEMNLLIKAVAAGKVPAKVLKVNETALRDYFRLHDGGSPPGVTMTQEIIAV